MVQSGFPLRRREAVARLPEFEALRDIGRAIKEHTLAHLDFYLELYEQNVVAAGGEVHWARTPEEACAAVLKICRAAGAKTVTKGKSMIAEEIGLNEFLEQNGITPVETDLGEYIIQLRHEPPSHLIAPAMHLVKEQVADTFRAAHRALDPNRPLAEPRQLCDEARALLRPRFLAADVGITGANFLVAETGSSIIVTNEGNGDLTQTLPRVHIVVASLEKLVPTFEDAASLLRLLARSATGQEFSSYTTVSTGPRRPGDLDGPQAYHVVLLDNGRSAMLGGEFHDMLRCIRCAACMNHCPVYAAVGGHAYGWVYPGPMGAVLTPSLIGIEEAAPLPNASTLCGRCESVCPVKIPLPKMLRHWREREYAKKLVAAGVAGRALAVGLGGAPAGALSRADRGREPRARLGRRPPRPVPQPAAGRRLDLGARHAGAGRAQLSQPVGRAREARSRAGERGARRYPAGIRRSLQRGRLEPPAEAELRARVAAHRRNLVPARAAALDHAAQVDLFVAMAEEVQATVARVASPAEVPEAVARYLAAENLPAELVMAPDPSLDEMPWETRPLLRIRRGRAEPEDAVSLTPCFAAVAETGTLMLVSGAQTPTTLNFLPDTHIAVVRADQIVGTYEDGWDRLRAASARRARKDCRAWSISSPGRRAPAISSSASCWVRTGRAGSISSSSTSGRKRRMARVRGETAPAGQRSGIVVRGDARRDPAAWAPRTGRAAAAIRPRRA